MMKKTQIFGADGATAYAAPAIEIVQIATETGFATSPGGEFTEIDDNHVY